MFLRLAIALFAIAFALPAKAQADVVRTGKSFALTLHPGKLDEALAARLADEALAALEALRPTLDKLGVKPPMNGAVHLHAGEATYRPLEKGATTYSFLAEDFTRADGSEAHVLLWPELSAEVLGTLGLPPWTAQSLQRCGVEMAALQAADHVQQDPFLAQVVAFGVLDAANNPAGKYGVDPSFDDRRSAYADHHRKGNASLFDSIVRDLTPTVKRDQLAMRHEKATLTAQLCATTGASWARRLLAKQQKPLAVLPTRQALFTSILGKDDAKTEHRFSSLLATLKPVWKWTNPGIGARGGKIVLAAGKDSIEFRAFAPPPTGPFAVRGKARLQATPKGSLRIALGEAEQLQWNASLESDGVSLHVWDKAKSKWQQVKYVERPLGDREFELSVEFDGNVRVLVDGALVVEAPRDGRDVHGVLVVGFTEALVFLDGLRCEPLGVAKKK